MKVKQQYMKEAINFQEEDKQERRGQAETDPIKKARIAQFLKEYWGVRNGINQYKRVPHNGEGKTSSDIAETIGAQPKHLNRILKLNKLIPQIQQLVSSKQLGTTAAEQLAYLSEGEQVKLSLRSVND
ncbi:hypothetical protein [Planococcus sp. S3-L1]|uniref:hypothetical protein n=1 Tax=Planococcus sp. S3-L1 TaxID=3046200 RepID=UPI0024B91BF6|nr:hypothetical protein [Planococcus sp. S3-L1]MDJ0331734.1 hypothetical protein [Planococcus sp. S3-L1]